MTDQILVTISEFGCQVELNRDAPSSPEIRDFLALVSYRTMPEPYRGETALVANHYYRPDIDVLIQWPIDWHHLVNRKIQYDAEPARNYIALYKRS